MSKTYSAGLVTAYGAAVRGGYTGTYAEWCAVMADFGDKVQQAIDAAGQAAQSASEAETAAEAASQDYTELSGEVKELKSAVDTYIENEAYPWAFEMGAITVNGSLNSATGNTSRIRTTSATAFMARKGDMVICDSAYDFRVGAWNSNDLNTQTFYGWANDWKSGVYAIPDSYVGKVVMLLIRNHTNPSGNITDELSTIGNHIKYYRVYRPLSGRYLSVMGDSISAYQGYIPDGYDYYYTGSNHDVSDVSEMWWSVVCARTGMNRCIINAYSGSGVTQLEDSSHVNKVPMSNAARCAALSDANHTPDVIVIMGGLNDYTYAQSGQSAPLEWDGTSEPVDLASFTQQYAIMIKQIQTNYPNASIVACSTNFSLRGDSNGYTRTHTVGTTKYTQYDYDTAIEHVCGLMNIPYIDISRIGFNPGSYYNAYASDSSTIPTHPNARGQKVLGAYVADRLTEILGPIMNIKQVS